MKCTLTPDVSNTVTFPEQPELLLEEPYGFPFRNVYRNLSDYIYRWEKEGTEYQIRIYEDVRTDLASIPPVAWPFINQYDLGLGPPLVHDALYRSGGRINASAFGNSKVLVDGQWKKTAEWSRYDADRLFGRMMREKGIDKWKRRSAYKLVRLAGFRAFDRERKRI